MPPEDATAAADTVPAVGEIMQTDIPVAAPTDSIATVARLLADHRLEGIPVVADGELVGIVTESDLVFREAEVSPPTIVPFLDAILVADAGRPFEEDLRRALAVTAGELMSSPVYSIRDTATLQQVATLMVERNVNPVPVVDATNTLVGLVSRADLVRVIARLEGADGGSAG